MTLSLNTKAQKKYLKLECYIIIMVTNKSYELETLITFLPPLYKLTNITFIDKQWSIKNRVTVDKYIICWRPKQLWSYSGRKKAVKWLFGGRIMVVVLWSYHGGRLVAVGGPIFKL